MASAAMQSDFSWSMAVRRALVAAAVTLLLTIGIFGVETVSSTGKLDFATRFPEVVIIVVSLFVGSILLSLMKAGRILVPMAVAGAVFVALLIALLTHSEEEGAGFLPFKDVVIDWATLIIPAVIFARSVNLWFSAKRRAGAVESAAVVGPKRSLRLAFKILGGILLVLAFALPWLPLGDNQRKVLDIFTLVATYVMLGWGLNIVVGLAGLLDLGYVAFYAVGAYSYALLSLHLDWSFWLCLPVAGGLAALFGIMLGFPVLRLRGDYLAIVTLGFGEIIRVILINWYWFTGGPNGINKVARPSFFGLPFDKDPEPGTETFHTYFGLEFDPIHRVIFLYYLILIFALITNFFTLRMRKLPLGRAWEALREDETACRALGINPTNTKLTAFAIGAMFAGFAGSFFGARQGFVSPESFVFLQSAIILAIVVLGGLGSQIGIVLAATVLIGVPEIFRELQDYRMLAFGTGMVLIMVWRPGGLVAHRDPTIKLSPKAANGGGA